MYSSAACAEQAHSHAAGAMRSCLGTLQCDDTCPPTIKSVASRRGSGPHPSNTSFPGPAWVSRPTDMHLGSAVFAQRTNTHTDNATCDICSNRPHLPIASNRLGLKLRSPRAIVCRHSFHFARLHNHTATHVARCAVYLRQIEWIWRGFGPLPQSPSMSAEMGIPILRKLPLITDGAMSPRLYFDTAAEIIMGSD